jgi:hypothetical protein
MSICTNDEAPDFERGLRISAAAWQTRKRVGRADSPYKPRPLPAITTCHFERDGKIIAASHQRRVA